MCPPRSLYRNGVLLMLPSSTPQSLRAVFESSFSSGPAAISGAWSTTSVVITIMWVAFDSAAIFLISKVVEHHFAWAVRAIATAERVVVDRNRVTAAGVSAEIDCGLQLVSLLRGQEAAEAIQLQIEYDPQPPFHCGSADKAPKSLVQRLTEASKATIDARRAVVEQLRKGARSNRP